MSAPTPQELATQIAIEQRNEQANRCVNLAVSLHVAKAKIAELEAKVAELEKPKDGE